MSPDNELVGLVVARLRSAASLAGLTGDRAYYRAPDDAEFPYLATEETDALREDGTDLRATQTAITVHVWTRPGDLALQEARQIAGIVADELHDAALALPTNTLITLDHRDTRVFYDADGLTGHGIVTLFGHTEA